MRFAHISDLHFGSFSISPFQFFSKRWVGNFNFLFTRKKTFAHERLKKLLDFFKEEKITHVVITGDFSVTSRRCEFSKAKKFVHFLEKEGLKVFTLPGNHDHYTKRSYRKKKFYRFFESKYDPNCPFNLREHKVTYIKIRSGLWVMALDTALATSMVSSQGYFSPEVEENLEKALKEIPKEDSIILLNHFPFFQNEEGKKELIRASILKKILSKYPNVFLYLHGHTHRQTVADLRPNQLPIISDSGSTPHIEYGACHLFQIDDNAIKLDVYRYEDAWKERESYTFTR